MTVRIIAFTRRGIALAQRLTALLEGENLQVSAFSTKEETGSAVVVPVGSSLRRWTQEAMAGWDGIVFIGACGIAVRSVAPFLRGKDQDPAVVVVDENGQFAVSLLSGHIGGANDLARRVARLLGAVPVVTTATDSGGRFAVDEWAVKEGLWIVHLKAAKGVSMAILEGEPVGFCSQVPWEGSLPQGLVEKDEGPVGICVSYDQRLKPFAVTLNLVPRTVVLGIGCRKGIPAPVIAAQVQGVLDSSGIPREAVTGVATIDRKGEEPGLLAFCREWDLPLAVFSAEELAQAEGAVTASSFVQKTVGVDNVCERAALRQSGGVLLVPKQAGEGVTVAAAAAPMVLRFGRGGL